jgi:hypothetical protein
MPKKMFSEPSPALSISGRKIHRPVIDIISIRLLEHKKEALTNQFGR